MSQEITSCRFLAPEDISVGDYVTQMQSVCEIPSFLWACAGEQHTPEEPVRYVHTPCDSGDPARVRSVCLPFLFVELAHGWTETWDLRQCRLARVSDSYARQIWKEMKPLRTIRKRELRRALRRKK